MALQFVKVAHVQSDTFLWGYDGTMTLALAVLTDIDVKFIFAHSKLYSFAAVTQTCPERVIL